MKYLKTYEAVNRPKNGDYVVIKSQYDNIPHNVGEKYLPEFNKFINNTVGKLIDIYIECWIVEYENIPNIIKDWFVNDSVSKKYGSSTRSFEMSELIYWSPNKEECELFLASKKYNI